jgi:murein DD-endopeptidase MepM/ murein hydrolase activator NlpD
VKALRSALIALFVVGAGVEASAQPMAVTSTAPPVRFWPSEPRLGDLLSIYVEELRPEVVGGVVSVFGYRAELVRVSRRHLRALAGVPIDITPKGYPVVIDLGSRKLSAEVVVVDRPFDSSTLSVSARFTRRPSKELQTRLAEEQRRWSLMWKPEPGAPRFFGAIHRPVDGIETSPFGTRRVFNGKTKSRHYGLDLEGATGDPVRAAQGGKIVMSSMRWTSGGTLVIDHGGGLFTAYFHLSRRYKKVGDWVKAGERIGLVGMTGRVTGPHLHLAVMVRMARPGRSARALYVDPAQFLGLNFPGEDRFLDTALPEAPGIVALPDKP